MTNDTLYVVVTCSLERSRQQILEVVIDSLRLQDPSFLQHCIVFDNASTQPETIPLLRSLFPRVYQSRNNAGYWSALNWALTQSTHILGRSYRYIYVIESDMVHVPGAFTKLDLCERVLVENQLLGSVRTEEFNVETRELYDKGSPQAKSRRYAWVHQTNAITGERIEFKHLEPMMNLFSCNFLTKVPSLTRMDTMLRVFSSLRNMLDGFSELDFQHHYHSEYPQIALLNYGIYNCQLANLQAGVVNGSWETPESRAVGYRLTRLDTINSIEHVNLV